MATLSVREAARELGLSTPTVWRLLRRREIGYAKCGRRVLVPQEEVQRFLRSRFTPALDACPHDGGPNRDTSPVR